MAVVNLKEFADASEKTRALYDAVQQKYGVVPNFIKAMGDNPAFLEAIERGARQGGVVHLMGLVSDGGVHSQLDHLSALISMCGEHGVKPLLHVITDGRDTAPRSAMHYLPTVDAQLRAAGGGIASICGRYYAMDRDRRWARTELAWKALVRGEGNQAKNITLAIQDAYETGVTDEFFKPTILPEFTPIQE